MCVANFNFFSFHRLFQVLESVYTSAPFLGLTRNVSNNVFLRIMYERAHAATLRWKFYLSPFKRRIAWHLTNISTYFNNSAVT